MKITNQHIEKLDSLSNTLETNRFTLSEQIKTAQDRFKYNEISVTRNGKKTKVTERLLWEEVYQAGVDCEGGKALKEKYPEIFELQEKVTSITQEINNFTAKEMGFMFSDMNIGKLLDLTKAMVDYRLKEKSLINKIITKIYAYFGGKKGR